MYLGNIIDLNDVYDFAHTNSNGYKKIGAYIYNSEVIEN